MIDYKLEMKIIQYLLTGRLNVCLVFFFITTTKIFEAKTY